MFGFGWVRARKASLINSIHKIVSSASKFCKISRINFSLIIEFGAMSPIELTYLSLGNHINYN